MTLEEIKTIYENEVNARVEKEGLSIGHSIYDIKDDVLCYLFENYFDDKLPTEKDILDWFNKECQNVNTYLNTESF